VEGSWVLSRCIGERWCQVDSIKGQIFEKKKKPEDAKKPSAQHSKDEKRGRLQKKKGENVVETKKIRGEADKRIRVDQKPSQRVLCQE